MITHQDIKKMSESELAVFASKAPPGLSLVRWEDGTFSFYADWAIEKMSPSQLAKVTVIGRAH